MRKNKLYSMATGLGIVLAVASIQSQAQTVDNNFGRDHSVGVNDRAKTEFTPLGLRFGTFMAQPSVGISLNTNDNVKYEAANKKSDVILQLTPGVDVKSDWGRHSLAFGVNSVIDQYGKISSENTAAYNLYAKGQLDITSRANLFGAVTHNHGYESRASFLANPNAAKPVPIDTDAVSAGFTVIGNRLRFIGNVGSQKEAYGNVASTLGGTISGHQRDMTTNTVSGRVDYALSPDVSFFVYSEGSKREFDVANTLDSTGSIISVGTSFDLNKLARGEIQVGSISQNYKSLASGKQTSTYFNGKVEWFPTQITTVTGTVGTSYSDAPTVGAVTALTNSIGLGIDHELLRNLILSGALNNVKYDFTVIDRTDTLNTYTLGARYYMSRRVYLNANLNHQKLESKGAQAFKAYTDNNLQVGIVLKY